tara:strand:- start:120 stop:806 length:687 start_codon:yes stop_codon:yes gene_type:complete
MSEYSDWIKSPRSARVWLEDSMTTLGQFAFVNPLHRLKHWNNKERRRVDCWQQKGKPCFYCQKGFTQIHDYTYGLYTEKADSVIRYLSTNLSTHTHFQRIFSSLFDDNKNPCDMVFEITKKKITTLNGTQMNGYDIIPTDEDMFVAEVLRPSPLDPFQNQVAKFKWIVPEELVLKLIDYDNKPFNLIDLFLLIKEKMPKLSEIDAKMYAVKLLENGVMDLKKAKEYRH